MPATDDQLHRVQEHKTAPRNGEPTTVHASVRAESMRSRPTFDDAALEVAKRARIDLERKNTSSRLLSTSGAGARHLEARIERTDHPWWTWLDKINAKRGTGILVALYGINGPGKTQMGVELVRASCAECKQGVYTTATLLFLDIRRAMKRDGMSERDALGEFIKPALLVIDECQRRGESKWEDNQLEEVIDWRYREARDTILISNLERSAFEDAMGPAIRSRMTETGAIIECNWGSFRKR